MLLLFVVLLGVPVADDLVVWFIELDLATHHLDAKSLVDPHLLLLRAILLSLDLAQNLQGICEVLLVMHDGISLPGGHQVLVVAEAKHFEQVFILSFQVALFVHANDRIGQLREEIRSEVLGDKLLHLVPQTVEIARARELIQNLQKLRVLFIELLPQELLFGAVALEGVKEDPQEGLLELLSVLVRGSLVALSWRHIRPLLLFSHLLLRKLFEALHHLVDAERGRALTDSLPEDLEVALVLHASLVSYHGILLVREVLLLQGLEGLLSLGIDVREQLALLVVPIPALGLRELPQVLDVPQEVVLDLGVGDVDQEEEDGVIVQPQVLAELFFVNDCWIVDLAALCSLVLILPPLLLFLLLFPGLVGFFEDGLGFLLLSLLLLGGAGARGRHAGIRGGVALRGAIASSSVPLGASSEEFSLIQVIIVVFLLR